MDTTRSTLTAALSGLILLSGSALLAGDATGQEQTAAATEAASQATAPEPLSDEELEVLVARIALYPDELVAAISAASLYPVQIIEAQRFLDRVKTKPDLKPKSDWDGSVVSLMNYPEIIKMMAEDLDWTQALGEALSNQQKDVLVAIQQLREKAVAAGVIKTDDKVKVVEEDDNIVIQPASAEVVYVPQYPPEMLYEPDYVYAPITYYPDPYPHYYDPVAPYFAAFVTGAIWASVVDWNDWGVWGGNNWGNDIDIDCNNCFNNRDFNGKVNLNDVDWRNVDRSKINFDKKQFNKIDNTKFKNTLKTNDRNNIKNKSADLKKNRPSTLPAGGGKQVKDVRTSTLDGLKSKPAGTKLGKPSQGAAGKIDKRPAGGKIDRPVGKPKPAARPDVRPKSPSPIGDMNRGKNTKIQSNRGGRSMGGGASRGVSKKKRPIPIPRGGGGRRR
jgi:hypothetical protein